MFSDRVLGEMKRDKKEEEGWCTFEQVYSLNLGTDHTDLPVGVSGFYRLGLKTAPAWCGRGLENLL